jgi:tetratricopeptide (TPR) repeat protein
LLAEISRQIHCCFPKGGLYYDVLKDGLNIRILAERICSDCGFSPVGLRHYEAIVQALSSNPRLLVIDACSEFGHEDWVSFGKVLQLVEQRRAIGGFDSFPSGILISARAIPQIEHELNIEVVHLEGLSDSEGAELLRKLTRDQGPAQWKNQSEREWVSHRVGGHPEMLRLIANHARSQDYRILKRGIMSIRGQLLKRMENVIYWAVERLGAQGRRLTPYIACFKDLSFEGRELAVAADIDPDSMEYEEGLDQLQYKGGLIHWDHMRMAYYFHSTLYEWARQRIEDDDNTYDTVTLLDRESLHEAHGRLAAYWESHFNEIPDIPTEKKDLAPVFAAINYRIARRESEIALKHLWTSKDRLALGCEDIQEFPVLLERLGLVSEWLAIARKLVSITDRRSHPNVWAKAIRNVGNAWYYRPSGDKGRNIEKAIRCYELELEIFTRDNNPFEWARTINNLGIAWFALPDGDRVLSLKNAIKYWESSLEVFTRGDTPDRWSAIMVNLGNAFLEFPDGDKAEKTETAILHFEKALEVRRREVLPYEWAITTSHLGRAWTELPAVNRQENLEKAIDMHLSALEVLTREKRPMCWAESNYQLGLVWLARAEPEKAKNTQADYLKKAIGCFDNALAVWTEEALPHHHYKPGAALDRATTWLKTGEDPGEKKAD